jgi:peptidase E
MPGPLTLIGSGETSERMLNLHQSLLARLDQPCLAFVDTPAAFQLNADQLAADAAGYFKKHFRLDMAVARYRSAADEAGDAASTLQAANYIFAGPGSPTYAVKHWRNSAVWAALIERWNAGAQLVFASSATIAISRLALPVYEIYKVGDAPFWAEGLDLLGPLGFDLAIIPHYNNQEGRTYDTRYCFMGEPRLLLLEKLLPPATVILGIDENTACTLDFDSKTIAVSGAGNVILRHREEERRYPDSATFPLDRLFAANALEQIPNPKSQAPSFEHEQSPNLQSSLFPLRPTPPAVPAKVREWAAERDRLRAEKKYAESDQIRARIAAVGYSVKDSPAGPVFTLTRYSNSNAIPSRLDKPDTVKWSVNLLAHNNHDEIVRAARSALRWSQGHALEVVIVDNGSDDGTAEAIAELATADDRIHPVLMASNLGEGTGRNAGFRASGGRHIMILGGHVEIAGDVFTPLAQALADEAVGAAGSNGLVSADLFTFNPTPGPDCDAIEFYLFAFRRERLKVVPMLDEKFVFYRNLDLDWSLAFKDKGLRLVTTPQLPVTVHEHPYLRMDPTERDRLSKKNYRRFLDKWRERKDLLLSGG